MGKIAARQTFESLQAVLAGQAGIGSNNISTFYRFKANPTKWYFKLNFSAHITHYEKLSGVVKDVPQLGIIIHVNHQNKEKQKGWVQFLTFTTRAFYVQDMVRRFTGDKEATATKIVAENKWVFPDIPQEVIQIPHHRTIKIGKTETRTADILITLHGRHTVCSSSGLDTHWNRQCPERKNSREKRGPTTQMAASADGETAQKGEPHKIIAPTVRNLPTQR
jgi:hypothetical protein